jgi:small subunit ribosomal protein S23
VRRFANQVHHQVSRLMRANYIKKEPAWYQAVLQYPPLPLPPKASTSRTGYDHSPDEPKIGTGQPVKLRKVKTRPLPIRYVEDDVRRQFFRDHPFEAFRPKTLVEGAGIEAPHPIQKENWTRLRQRGRNPSPEE